MNLNSLAEEIYVVNLSERKDRLESINNQFKAINSTFTRFDAIKGTTGRRPGTQGNKMSWHKILSQAIDKGQETIAICEDDACFRRSIVPDIPTLAKLIKETDFEILSFHHCCKNESEKGKNNYLERFKEYEDKEPFLIHVSRKPWCNQFLVLQNLKKWRDHIHSCINTDRSLDNCLTVFKANCYTTSKEYCFQLDDFSSIQNRTMKRFSRKSLYKDLIQ